MNALNKVDFVLLPEHALIQWAAINVFVREDFILILPEQCAWTRMSARMIPGVSMDVR